MTERYIYKYQVFVCEVSRHMNVLLFGEGNILLASQ